MNIETLSEDIQLYYSEVMNSGFSRDISDYASSIANMSENIVALRELASTVLGALTKIENGDLPDRLRLLLPEQKLEPFTSGGFREELITLVDDKVIERSNFYSRLKVILQNLDNVVSANENRVLEIENFIKPYIEKVSNEELQKGKAHASIVFKDEPTISGLDHFTKTLKLWNRTLPIYHQLLTSTPPEEIGILAVQNGSIEVVVNLNIELAIGLAEVFKVGYEVFVGFLVYKAAQSSFEKYYHGNKELQEMDSKKETLMLDNIGVAVRRAITDQHKEAKKQDKDIVKNQQKVIDEVAKLISSHLIKGNDFRLLSYDSETTSTENHEDTTLALISELGSASAQARSELKKLPKEELIKLIEKYKSPEIPE